MSWHPSDTIKYPIEQGDEITAAHFNVIRKLMFSIDEMTWPTAWEEPDDWSPYIEYNRGSQVMYMHPDGVKYRYLLYNGPLKGTPPPKGGWKLTNRDVFCDFARNSGCYDNDWWGVKAYKRYPPHLNKYTQYGSADEDSGIYWPQEKMFIVAIKYKPTDTWHYFEHDDCKTGLFRKFDELDFEEKNLYDLSTRVEGTVGKLLEDPIEFAQFIDRFGEMIISGPIGPQYVEMHPTFFGWAPPWYYPYYSWPGRPDFEDEYFCKKFNGYQSRVERFVEYRGSTFKWPKEPEDDACDPGYLALRDWGGQGNNSSYWKCNWSSFEKCLSIIAGEGIAQAKATDKYDWFLDYEFPPDPNMWKLQTPYYQEYLLIKAVWRRTWRYSFTPPRNGILWPGEWGPPPHWDEDYNWWARWENVYHAYWEARSIVMRADKAEDMQACINRHYPTFVTRKIDEAYNQDNNDDFDWWQEVQNYLDAWNQIIELILGSGGTNEAAVNNLRQFAEEHYYELTNHIVKDMIDVLGCLKYLTASISKSVDSEHQAWNEGVQTTKHAEWSPWCGLTFMPWFYTTGGTGGYTLGSQCGKTDDFGPFAGGVKSWSPFDDKFMYSCSGLFIFKCREIAITFSGNDISNLIKHAKFSRVNICWEISGYRGSGAACNYEGPGNVEVYYGSANGYHTCMETIYKWASLPVSAINDSSVTVKYSASTSGAGWGAPQLVDGYSDAMSIWRQTVSFYPHTYILIILDPYLVDLKCNEVERTKLEGEGGD